MRTVLQVLLGMILAIALMVGAVFLLGRSALQHVWAPDPETIASASLQGLQAENRLTALVATYVAVVTSSQSRFGLSAQRTLIMPGRVRYEVDLAQLQPNNVRWDKATRTLDIILPALDLDGPEVEPSRIRAYDSGGLLLKFTDSGQMLDASNRKAAQIELLRQARETAPMQFARDAARKAVTQNFALPLKAAGLDPHVRVRFVDEPAFAPEPAFVPLDHSRSVAEVLGLSR